MNIDDLNGLPRAEDVSEVMSAEHAAVVSEIRGALLNCDNRGIDKATVNAVLIAELLPLLRQNAQTTRIRHRPGCLPSREAEVNHRPQQQQYAHAVPDLPLT